MSETTANHCTLAGKAIYNPRPETGQSCWFNMHGGASRYGYGQMLMRRADYDAIKGTFPASLVLTSGVTAVEQTKQTVTIPVVIAGYKTYSTDVRGSDNDLVWAIIYDQRAQLTTPVSKAYNVQRDDLSSLFPSTKNGGSDWTWNTLLDDIGCAAESWASLPSWKPRNIVYDGIPSAQAVDDIANRFRALVGYDYTASSGTILANLRGYHPGTLASQNSAINTDGWQAKYRLNNAGSMARESVRKPASYDFIFPAIVATADPFASGARGYVKNVASSLSPTPTGPKRVIHVGEYPAISDGAGGWTNSSELDAVAADLASRLDAEASLQFDTYLYGGFWPNVCDGVVRGILWSFGVEGATTTLRYGDERSFTPLEELQHNLRDAGNQLVVAYGSGRVGLGLGRTRYVISSVRQSVAVHVTGSASGGGKYAGKIVNANSSAVSASGNLTGSDIGADGANCLILNAQEVGQSTHDLTASPVNVAYFIGTITGYTTDTPAKPVVTINGIDWENCS